MTLLRTRCYKAPWHGDLQRHSLRTNHCEEFTQDFNEQAQKRMKKKSYKLHTKLHEYTDWVLDRVTKLFQLLKLHRVPSNMVEGRSVQFTVHSHFLGSGNSCVFQGTASTLAWTACLPQSIDQLYCRSAVARQAIDRHSHDGSYSSWIW